MENPFDEMRRAVAAAREVQRAIETQASTLAHLLDGNLHHVNPYMLKKLKKQLARFNAHTNQWKD